MPMPTQAALLAPRLSDEDFLEEMSIIDACSNNEAPMSDAYVKELVAEGEQHAREMQQQLRDC